MHLRPGFIEDSAPTPLVPLPRPPIGPIAVGPFAPDDLTGGEEGEGGTPRRPAKGSLRSDCGDRQS